jgi:hypothetical protein
MRLQASVRLFRRQTGVLLSVRRTEFIRNRRSEGDLAEGLQGRLEAGLGIATAIIATSAVLMAIEATGAC